MNSWYFGLYMLSDKWEGEFYGYGIDMGKSDCGRVCIIRNWGEKEPIWGWRLVLLEWTRWRADVTSYDTRNRSVDISLIEKVGDTIL